MLNTPPDLVRPTVDRRADVAAHALLATAEAATDDGTKQKIFAIHRRFLKLLKKEQHNGEPPDRPEGSVEG